MLEPQDRTTLMDLVRPPEGCSLDCAIGTTYSLDLLAMLFVPLAFTMFEWERSEDGLETNCVPILESLRRYADRYLVFCQAGRIGLPAKQSPLFSYLEKSVIEVTAPHPGGAFHPKVWALRYSGEDGIIYRLLCLSRNLTFDRSWDTALALEGPLVDRTYGIGLNRPLGEFYAALPALAQRGLPSDAREQVSLVADELRRVKFEPPPGLEMTRFWPLSIPGHSSYPFGESPQRLLIVSPFLAGGAVEEFADWCGGDTDLISRPDQIDALTPQCREKLAHLYCLDTPSVDEEVETPPDTDDTPLEGLHAKLYVADKGHHSRIWTGSANATDAAYQRNVEFLVELTAKKSQCGVQALLADSKDPTTLGHLLRPHEPAPPAAEDPALAELQGTLEAVKQALLEGWSGHVSATDPEGSYQLTVTRAGMAVDIPADVRVMLWPITLKAQHARTLADAQAGPVSFGPLGLEELTSFLAFEVRQVADLVPALRFVLNVPTTGFPADREQRLLKAILHDTDRVIRFILLLLAEQRPDLPEMPSIIRTWMAERKDRPAKWDELPLFEALVKALHHDPSLLDHVKQLVDDLNEGEGPDLLPPGFMQVWEPIWAARQELSQG